MKSFFISAAFSTSTVMVRVSYLTHSWLMSLMNQVMRRVKSVYERHLFMINSEDCFLKDSANPMDMMVGDLHTPLSVKLLNQEWILEKLQWSFWKTPREETRMLIDS